MKRYSSCFGQHGFGFRKTRSSTVTQTDVSEVQAEDARRPTDVPGEVESCGYPDEQHVVLEV